MPFSKLRGWAPSIRGWIEDRSVLVLHVLLFDLALVAANTGDEPGTVERALAAERIGLTESSPMILAPAQHARGVAALVAGRPAEAFGHLRRLHDPADPCFDPGTSARAKVPSGPAWSPRSEKGSV